MSGRTMLEFFAWYGVAAVLVAFALLIAGMVDIHSPIYAVLNLTGAIGIGWHAYKKRDYQPVVTNIIWTLIALWGLVNILK